MEKNARKGAAFVNGAEIRDSGDEMSFPEKKIMFMACGPRPELPYPLRKLETAWGKPEMEYVIPDADRQKVLEEVYLFQDAPKLDDILFDIHEGRTFSVRDFRVIRWHGANLLTSPYFPRSGGMLVDWVAPGETDKAVRAFARKEDGDGE